MPGWDMGSATARVEKPMSGVKLRQANTLKSSKMTPVTGLVVSASPSLHPDDLGNVPLFAQLGAEQHRRLLENHRLLTLEKDQQLILEQEESQGLFLLRSGLLKVRCMGMDGEETVLALLGPGEVCGEMASLNPKGLRSADVITLTPCSLVILRGGPFTSLLHSEPGFALALARLQAQRLRDLNKRFSLRGADASTRMLATLAEAGIEVRSFFTSRYAVTVVVDASACKEAQRVLHRRFVDAPSAESPDARDEADTGG